MKFSDLIENSIGLWQGLFDACQRNFCPCRGEWIMVWS